MAALETPWAAAAFLRLRWWLVGITHTANFRLGPLPAVKSMTKVLSTRSGSTSRADAA